MALLKRGRRGGYILVFRSEELPRLGKVAAWAGKVAGSLAISMSVSSDETKSTKKAAKAGAPAAVAADTQTLAHLAAIRRALHTFAY